MIAAFFSTHTLRHLLGQYGYLAVFLFVMVESLGIPFPGETMVIAAAVYAGATHSLSVWGIWLVAAAAAIVGDNIGFGIGHWGGYRLLRRYGSKVRLDEAKLKVGRLIFDRHGGKVVFFGRFVSILRTYAAFLAGTNRMQYVRFLAFNASGGILWSAVYSFGFYYLGAQLKNARGPVDYGLGAAAFVIVVAFIIWLRRHEKRLEAEAEVAYPGPLDEHMQRRSSEASTAESEAADGHPEAPEPEPEPERPEAAARQPEPPAPPESKPPPPAEPPPPPEPEQPHPPPESEPPPPPPEPEPPPVPPSDHARKDEAADDDEYERGEGVTPALEPDAPDLVAPAGGSEGEPDDRPDRDEGEDGQRADGSGDARSGGSEEHGEDGEVG